MSETDILLVEDEPAIRDMLAFSLKRVGMQLRTASDVQEAQNKIADKLPSLVLLDWMLPGMSGLEFARRMKKDEYTQELPIIMLTAKGEENDRVSGFDVGVDDYVIKPFSPRELIARIKAVLRRSFPDEEQKKPLIIGPLALDISAHRLTLDGEKVTLGPTEYRLLEFFMKHPDRVYSREQILDRIWGRNSYVEERTVDVHILRLRKALGRYNCEKLVQTVRGSGYRFSANL